jgi:hypothetical protein
MHFLVPVPCGTKLQIDLDFSVPVADAKACDGSTFVTEFLPKQPCGAMVHTVAVHVDVTAGAVALLHI